MARRRYYIMKDGARLYRDTLQEIKAVALREANRAGKAVRVMFEELDSFGRAVRSKPAVRQPVAKFHASRNPLMGGENFTGEQWKITGKSPRGTTVHAYASSKDEASLEARVLRSAGYRAVQTIRTKAPVEGITRRKVMGRNPVPKKRKRAVGACYVEYRNAGVTKREKYANKGLATIAAKELKSAGYAAVRVVASGKKP